MLDSKDIRHLSQLARVETGKKEEKKIQKDLENILKFVSRLKEAPLAAAEVQPPVLNVLRQDGNPHEAGFYSEALLKQSPETERGFVKVKKIFNDEN